MRGCQPSTQVSRMSSAMGAGMMTEPAARPHKVRKSRRFIERKNLNPRRRPDNAPKCHRKIAACHRIQMKNRIAATSPAQLVQAWVATFPEW